MRWRGMVGATLLAVVIAPSAAAVGPVPSEERPVAARVAVAPKASLLSAAPGERYELTGRFPRSVIDRRIELQRRDVARGTWTTVSAKRLVTRPAYRFVVRGDRARARWRVVAPAATVDGRRLSPVRSAPRVVTVARQSVRIAGVPAVVLKDTSVSMTASLRPARPGRPVRADVMDGGTVLQRLRGVEDASGKVSFSTVLSQYGAYDVRVVGSRYRGAEPVSAVAAVSVVPRQRPLVLAHRGGSVGTPENTMRAFESAIARGVDSLECDIQRTSDGSWVVMHDPDLRRTTDAARVFPGRDSYLVSAFTLQEIGQLSAGAPGVGVPTLEQVLGLVTRTGIPALVETKTYGQAAASSILEIARRHPGVIGPARSGLVEFDSFDLATLRAFRDLDSEVSLGFVSGKFPKSLDAVSWVDSLVIEHSVLGPDQVAATHARGLRLLAWTVDERADMWRLAELGVDGIITDDPAGAIGAIRGTQ